MVQFRICVFLPQRAKGSRHRFSVIVNELKATNRPEYKACILGFVNYLISACADLDSRLLLRAELNGRLIILWIGGTNVFLTLNRYHLCPLTFFIPSL